MLAYFCITGILVFMRVLYILLTQEEKFKELLEESGVMDPFLGVEYAETSFLLCVISLLFGWIIFPIWVAQKIYKLFTGKDLLIE